MKTMKFFTMMIMATGVSLTSCEGPEGPEGPAGINGEQGIQGEQGAQGEPGEDGNANVVTSPWIDSTFPDENRSSVSQQEFDEDITADIVDNGTILVYARFGAASDPNRTVVQLPFVTGERRFSTIVRIGTIFFQGQRTGTTNQNFTIFSAFRYVMIPSGTSKTNSINFKKMSYEEVMNHFGLDY